MATTQYTDTTSATAAIQAHPLCSEFVTNPNNYIVYYPAPYTIPGGVLVPRNGNDLASLNLLYAKLVAQQSGT